MAYFDDQPATLWTLHKDGRDVACAVRLMPYGIDVDIARDGTVLVTRTFESGGEALAWAAQKRAEREAQGWGA